jgi:hypothetical protein
MRIIILPLLLFLVINAGAQNNDYIVSMDGIGALKIGMKQDEVEKLLNKKLVLPNALNKADSWEDSASGKYNSIGVQLYFQRRYESTDSFVMVLVSVRTSSPVCKTKSGVGVGADKLKVIAAHENNYISMGPYYGEDYGTKIKATYLISVLSDQRERAIRFYLDNKKVVAIEVAVVFNDSE